MPPKLNRASPSCVYISTNYCDSNRHIMDYDFRIFDFHLYNTADENDDGDNGYPEGDDVHTNYRKTPTKNLFTVKMFGKNEANESCAITVKDFKPFFYVKVGDNWGEGEKRGFIVEMKRKLGNYHKDNLISCDIVRHKKLYEFDDGKKNTFLLCKFENLQALNKMKNLWYNSERGLLPGGFYVSIYNTPRKTEIYESFIPPLLRFFHIRNISPSGWIRMPYTKTHCVPESSHETTCDHEFELLYADIEPLNEKEDRVPLKIMSFDIEASSSHGDFPVPVKGYKKLATNVVDLYGEPGTISSLSATDVICCAVRTAFGFATASETEETDIAFGHGVDLIYPKGKTPSSKKVATALEKLLAHHIEDVTRADRMHAASIEVAFGRISGGGGDENGAVMDAEDGGEWSAPARSFAVKKAGVKSGNNPSALADLLASGAARETKLANLLLLFDMYLPAVEGDKVTFIGSTLQEYGDAAPYFNHCIALGSCDELDMEDTEIECYKTEREVLMAWRDFVVREDPDIIIGYNIFGFDYNFMFMRARELKCAPDFLEMSKLKDHMCGSLDKETGVYDIEHSNITIASGTHELGYIKMPGRIQLDLYNHFRREENLVSYKLDYVAGHFIGDYVSDVAHSTSMDETTVKTKNMAGLLVGSYVHFEEIGHSTDYYDGGAKFQVTHIDADAKSFTVSAHVTPNQAKKVRWALAKDDVTPKDIFRLTNEGPTERAIVAKYCIQDCNLVQYLLTKVDALTGMIEMANICSVPINFLILRGQGIKLTSYVGKKCREKDTLIPDIEKKENDGGYEGAIVLDPKSDLYMDNPVACVDYASLYPSSMISENLSHDSKVWTREYNLDGKLIEETGKTGDNGEFIYDNLPGYSYVDIEYDTYKYTRKSPSAAALKVKCGRKTCRFAQFPEGRRAIMPSILEELLKARKATRKLIPQQTDDFMKSVLDKRQTAYKLTANSLYGQCGARTSTFYEKDVAASTTATGRKLLTYAKRVIEEVYGDAVMDTKNHGKVRTKAEYVYGDTDSVFFTFNLETLDGKPIRGKQALEITIELSQEAGALASKFLKKPHDLEYEKTFMPFCLLSKKRYVGMLYEHDPNKGKRKEMGIVLKRRDNAPIVKEIYGGIIDILMKEGDNLKPAIDFLKESVQNLVDEKYPMEKLIISKSVRSDYKNPKQIAHKVLADRITARDPGNKPASGDRIPYVYIHNPTRGALQGDKIETPAYIIENNLKIDYAHYITNQVMKPVQQVFALVLEKIWMMQNKRSKLNRFRADVVSLKQSAPPDKFQDRLDALRCREIKVLLFDTYIHKANNQKQGFNEMTSYFGKL